MHREVCPPYPGIALIVSRARIKQVVTSRRVDTLGAAEPHSASRSPPLFRRPGQVQVSPAGKVGEPHSTSQLFFPRLRSLCEFGGSLDVKEKRGNKVPILLTDKTKSIIDLLMKTRKSVEIIPENLYMFAVPKSVHYIRCSASIRKYSYECGAEYPDKITSTILRKQYCTSFLAVSPKNETEMNLA
uniref:Uncharacterized protein n=1 Tax=Magallana gigas TaxID=29159 RepID=A0A8W8KYW0_MAGGI